MRAGWRLCGLIAWCAAVPARAEPRREVAVALDWRSADGCLDSEALRAQVRSRRRPAREVASADAVVAGRAELRAAGGWRVEIVVADRGGAILGRRALEVAEPGCAALREHVALVMAMLIDSSVVERAALAAPPPPSESTDAAWTADAAVVVATEAGRLPGAAPGGGLVVGLAAPAGWRGELALTAFAKASAADGAGETSLRWIAAGALACAPGLEPTRWHLTACAGLEAGIVFAEGAGFMRNRRDRELLIDGLGRLRVERRLVGPTFAVLALDARVAALRPRFGYEDDVGDFRPLYEPTPVAASGQLGLGAHFP